MSGGPNDEVAGLYLDRCMLTAQMQQLAELVTAGGLTVAGMRWAHRQLNTMQDVLTATGGMYELRERVVEALAVALSEATGMPASYWRERSMVEVPDDAASLE